MNKSFREDDHFHYINWNGYEIRFLNQEWDDNELTWVNKVFVVAKDVCDALGIKKLKKILKSLPESYYYIWMSDKGKPMEVLTEKGLYRLIFQSTSPQAESFQDWVLEVIQKIRLQSDMYYWQTLRILDKDEQDDLFQFLDQETMTTNPEAFGSLKDQQIPFVKQQGFWWASFDEVMSVLKVDPDDVDDRFAMWDNREESDADDLLLSENGIYQALLMSNLEEAKKFQDWVYSLIKKARLAKGYEVPEILDMVRDSAYWKINEELIRRD